MYAMRNKLTQNTTIILSHFGTKTSYLKYTPIRCNLIIIEIFYFRRERINQILDNVKRKVMTYLMLKIRGGVSNDFKCSSFAVCFMFLVFLFQLLLD